MPGLIEKNIVRKNFTNAARTYTAASSIQHECARELLNSLTGKAPANVLEIGCGTGHYTSMLLEAFPDASVTALDISPGMISQARSRIAPDRVEFICQDAEQLYTGVGDYDLITSNCAMQWFRNPLSALTMIKWGLSPAASLTFSIYGPGTFIELGRVLSLYFKGDTVTLQARDFFPLATVARLLKGVFHRVRYERRVFCARFENFGSLLRNIKHCGVRGRGLGHGRIFTKGDVERIDGLYRREFGDITVSHEVGFFDCHM